jgi:mRNA interferase RelE/StbE
MTYELAFVDEALKEWRKLDNETRDQFRTKLAERLQNPKIPSARPHGAKERYKIRAAICQLESNLVFKSAWG